MEALKNNINTEEENGFSLEIVSELGELGDGAIISESALAKLLSRHPVSIKRAVLRGELPQPIRLLGQSVWTVGVIVKFLEKRLEDAARDNERQKERMISLRP
jgi:hypothetical protein